MFPSFAKYVNKYLEKVSDIAKVSSILHPEKLKIEDELPLSSSLHSSYQLSDSAPLYYPLVASPFEFLTNQK